MKHLLLKQPYKARFGQAISGFFMPLLKKNHCRLGTYYAIILFANSDFCAWISPTNIFVAACVLVIDAKYCHNRVK